MVKSTEALVLAAVREEVMAYGVRRATATSIARRAGVSRVTVYRVGGTINDLVMSALVSEFRQLLDEVRVPDPVPAGADRLTVLVDEVLGFLSALRASPLFRALQHHDAEILLPYLLDRLGRSHEMLLSHLRERITGGIADGSVREVDPDRAALVLLLALQSFAVSGSIVQAHGHASEIEDEIRHVVTGYLQPVAPPAP